jgi:PQQ-dependent dehydrogenase (s-GDH family)
MLWVTERNGKRLTRVDPNTGERHVAATIDEISAPGGQEGLIGLALHPELLKGTGNDYVFVSYTYVDEERGADPNVPDPNDPYRYLYFKVVRYSFNKADGTLSDPMTLIEGLPAGNDHNAGRLKIGPDRKLYMTIGEHGNNQLGNYCLTIEAQRLPTPEEMNKADYVSYVGKTLRLNLDGSVPEDNPRLAGVVSHVFTYGHRNPQGIDFGPDGTLYESEHGPKTDDEVNILKPGANYGWPHVAGLRDDKAYVYARWAEASPTPCSELRYNDSTGIDPSVPRETESAYTKEFNEPLATLFTVETGYNFEDPVCGGIHYICWPTVGASSVEYYGAGGVPGWGKVLLVTALKRGSLYVIPLDDTGQRVNGAITRHFQSEDRYRDTAVSPDGKTIFIATDSSGLVEKIGGGTTWKMQHPGAILAFTYQSEVDGPIEPQPIIAEPAADPMTTSKATEGGGPPAFTPAQVAAGKTAYLARCAVCHGSNLTNGTFGTPLAGLYFAGRWPGKPVGALFEYAKTKMPPGAAGSLEDAVYAEIVAYILQVNGAPPGESPLPADRDALNGMTIP